ncbi:MULTISPECIES: M3 family metallopeptidase [unclassified Nocardioides]|uniref:M3 family metallopeptidase n=1 Tax=unclassified Nocardioides TaxID=2615069 RepID=UPI00266646E1|nr:M3 family metallopeptidase [Nocardioides sp. Arc9.136]WKN48481.1 Zn-dependent oligopeptidase [Nocardioides sp. Arc9.136]
MTSPLPSSPTPLELPDADSAEAWLAARTEDGLARARALVEELRADPPTDPVAALEQWDAVTRLLSGVAAAGSLFGNVHPLEAVRDTGDRAEQEVAKLATELSQDRALHDAFAALDPSGLDEQAARLLTRTLEDFRRAGVDRDDATRARIAELDDRLTELDQAFSRGIRDDVRSIRVAPERLAGLPQDWLDSHAPDEDGLVTVTTDYPDVVPVRTFCHDADVRRDIAVEFLQRGWPQNDEVLRELFALRHERATLVGYDSWPSYDAAVKMIGSGAAIPEFIDRIAEAAREPGERDLALVLDRLRRDRPEADALTAVDSAYYEELVRKEQLEVDAQLVRTYFEFAKVRQGLLDVTGRLFGLHYEPVPDAPVWAPDVTAYDVTSAVDGSAVGRIYLDLHPREGKYGHAAQFTLVDGVAGEQLPEGVLVCNFSRGLMEHDHVVTLFHEFGHLVHHVLGGHGRWARFAGVATEWDFVEAPSQMLEEWAWDAEVLRSFATDAAGEPIPADLVERMRRADDFGKGTFARVQMFYAAMSYWFHAERPDDLTARMVELQEQYSPLRWIEGTHMFASFGHLGGYSSAYYTYMWSLVIAKDLFSAFDPADLFDPEVAGRYRDRVLAPGGAKDAADLVEDFLGRPYTFDAYAAWLAR